MSDERKALYVIDVVFADTRIGKLNTIGESLAFGDIQIGFTDYASKTRNVIPMAAIAIFKFRLLTDEEMKALAKGNSDE